MINDFKNELLAVIHQQQEHTYTHITRKLPGLDINYRYSTYMVNNYLLIFNFTNICIYIIS